MIPSAAAARADGAARVGCPTTLAGRRVRSSPISAGPAVDSPSSPPTLTLVALGETGRRALHAFGQVEAVHMASLRWLSRPRSRSPRAEEVAARMACERRKVVQLSEVRSDVGSIAASLRSPRPWTRRPSRPRQHSPLMRRYRRELFSWAGVVVPTRGSTGRWVASRHAWGARCGVQSCDQVAVPAAHGFWAHDQPDPAPHVARQPVPQGGEEDPIGRGEIARWRPSDPAASRQARGLAGDRRPRCRTVGRCGIVGQD